jgi:hypothetical protein
MDMKTNRLLAALIALAMTGLSAGKAAASEVLFDSSGFLRGQQSFVQSFEIDSPGMLTVTLSNISWPERLSSLNLLITTANGLLAPEMGEGSFTLEVGKGDVFAHWFGTAQGPLNIGVYAMKIEFQPFDVVPVPLPTSLALLLSGLAMLAWQRRQHAGSLPGFERA